MECGENCLDDVAFQPQQLIPSYVGGWQKWLGHDETKNDIERCQQDQSLFFGTTSHVPSRQRENPVGFGEQYVQPFVDSRM